MTDTLRNALKKLRLSGLLESLEVRLQEAAGHNLSHAEFLELIVQDELVVRSDRQLQRRVKAACFRGFVSSLFARPDPVVLDVVPRASEGLVHGS